MGQDRLDLNLFRVFDAVMRHRALAAAGRDLGVSASAVSHALNRLRAALGDELFVSTRGGMSPTARALELAPGIAAATGALEGVVAARPFDPGRADRTFRLGMSDHNGALILPALTGRLLRTAPGLRLRVLPIGRVDLVEQLDGGRLDVVVSWLGATPGRIRRRSLFGEREALAVRPGHPLAGRPAGMAELLAFPHLVVELVGGGEAAPGGFFLERGVQRRVWAERLLLESGRREAVERMTTVTVPSFALAAPLLRATDLIATLPFRLARRLEAEGALAMLDLPYVPIDIETEAAWHERTDQDPALAWLVGELSAVCAAFDPLPGPAPGSTAK